MTKTEEAKAQLVIVTGLLLLHFIFNRSQHYFLIAAAAIGIISIFIPVAGTMIVRGWYKLAEVLGAVNGRILLSIVFFIVLFPIALISRFLKNDQLGLKRNGSSSVFVERNHKYESKDFDKVW